ncbi:MAG: LuxR C-terminal-related transcriptional regulator [Verrucomicrobiales bacterium]|nr:LuxR C-terminal-related transcriptional regulator [Verrucomicrobiales bacterium]
MNPSIVVLHFKSETVNNLALIHFLRTKFPSLRILVVSDQNDEVSAERALRLGANGYLPRSEMEHECVHALRVVARMDAYTTPAIAARIFRKAYQGGLAHSKRAPALTAQEMRILGLLGAGLDHREIARRLRISRPALQAQCAALRRKLRLRSNEALRAYASGRL